MKQVEGFWDKGLRIFRKFKGSVLLMHLRNIWEYGNKKYMWLIITIFKNIFFWLPLASFGFGLQLWNFIFLAIIQICFPIANTDSW